MTRDSASHLFEIENLVHRFNGTPILDIPRLSLQPGKIYALVGPNGSGKTTLLSILNLILPPTSGSISYRGEPAGVEEPARRLKRLEMSLLLQEPFLFNTTVYKNVAWGLEARGMRKDEIDSRVSWALELVRLRRFSGRRARSLSGGEAQRVALARALATRPSVLFLDEPTANVDHQSVLTLERVIGKLNSEHGMSVIMTTHNLNQAYRLADEVFTLFGGNLISSPMDNLFHGRVLEQDGRFLFLTAHSELEIPAWDSMPDADHALINPRDIIVSLEPFESSARNVLKGKITDIGERGKAVSLTVQAGEKFTIMITDESYRELALGLGTEVFLTFKASSVQLL